MPIRSQHVTAPQDRPTDDPKQQPPRPPAHEDMPESPPEPIPPAHEDRDKDDDADQSRADKADEVKAEAGGRVLSRVIALPRREDTGEVDLFDLEIESMTATDTDYGDVAKFTVRAPKPVLDELEARAHDALTYKRTVPPGAASSRRD
jgi:hypothetical protein